VLGFGAIIDRGDPTMPATNGVIFVIVLGGFVALLCRDGAQLSAAMSDAVHGFGCDRSDAGGGRGNAGKHLGEAAMSERDASDESCGAET
jgi:hypothetical protein